MTTTRVTHATPAAAYAHTPERNWESIQDITDAVEVNGCIDIARQLIDSDLKVKSLNCMVNIVWSSFE